MADTKLSKPSTEIPKADSERDDVSFYGVVIMPFKPGPDKSASEIYPWMRVMEKSARERARCLNILVAEDNTLSQTLITRLLQKMRHVVTVANDGEEAVALCSKGAFDLIFMDIRMPKLDGIAAAACIRRLEEQSGSYIPIIAMTCARQRWRPRSLFCRSHGPLHG